MGAQLQGAGGRLGGRANKRRSRRKGLMSEINVTPFVDVMLVLLIIFMVTAPLLTSGVKVDLPEAKSPAIAGDDEPLSISLKANGEIYIQKTKISPDELTIKLIAITGQKRDTRIFIHGDKAVDYGHVIKVISSLNEAGYKKVSLVTENPI